MKTLIAIAALAVPFSAMSEPNMSNPQPKVCYPGNEVYQRLKSDGYEQVVVGFQSDNDQSAKPRMIAVWRDMALRRKTHIPFIDNDENRLIITASSSDGSQSCIVAHMYEQSGKPG